MFQGVGRSWREKKIFLLIKILVITFHHAILFVGATVQAGEKPEAKKGGPKL
jgi:hypothetical protein